LHDVYRPNTGDVVATVFHGRRCGGHTAVVVGDGVMRRRQIAVGARRIG
jgi:hypothetical protein